MASLGTIVDKVVGVFSPSAALRRQYYRKQLKRGFAAAGTPRTAEGWTAVSSSINDLISGGGDVVRSRVRQLVQDFPYFARAVRILTDYTVGPGILFQARVTDKNGVLATKINQRIEDAFHFWADQADVSGRLHYYEMMALAKRQDLEAGEYLLIKTYDRSNRSRYIPYCLQMYEADWLTDHGAKLASKDHGLFNGIEYDKTTGAAIAYHLTDPDSWGKTIRIPAESVIHGFETLRPGQLRGVSPFVSAVMVAHDLGDYMDAEIDAAKMAAKYLAFVKTPDPFSRQMGVGMTTDSNTGNKIEEIENAILEYLRPGEEIELASNPRPGNNLPAFVRLILTMISVATGAPYELLSGDYKGINYSTGRLIRNDFEHQLRPISMRHIRGFCLPTFNSFLETAVLAGKLSLPNYFANRILYSRCEWQPPGMASIDPLRETKARVEEVASGFRSPQEIAKSRNRSIEDIYKEIAEAKALAEKYGLEFGPVNTALKNNPAAVIDQGGTNEKK